MSLKLSPPLWA